MDSLPKSVQLLLGSVGALYLGSKVFSYIYLLLEQFLLPGQNLQKYGKKGSWAVVTAASDGLGKEFATQLASKGWNIVLVSRTLSKLETLAQEIEKKYPGVQTKVLAIDFSKDDESNYERLAALVDGLDIGILVNNVGQSHSIPVPFLETAREELQNIITINCLGTLKVTQTIAPGMQQRRRGLILNLGSHAGWSPSPLLATYSGTKAFLNTWSTALASELREYNVDVETSLAYLITGPMAKVRRSSAMIPNPKPWVRAALSKVGTGRTQAMANTFTPWWSHALLTWWVENVLGSGSKLAIDYTRKMHKDIRTRALRKAAREAKQQ